MASSSEITQLLHAYRTGDRQAGDKLFAMVYDELQAIAHRQLAYRRPGQTFSTQELVHEIYLKMIHQSQGTWQDRAHFFAVAARAMRHFLVDYARRKKAQKRGGGAYRTTLDASMLGGEGSDVEILDLEDGLAHLADLNPRLSEVVELRFFGGLSIEETAEVLGVSSRTIDRDWFKAKTILYKKLTEKGAL